jgi:transcription factor IIIB subunit 2
MLGPRPRPTPGPRPQNPLRNQKEIRAPTPLVRKATQNAATKRPPVKRLCPNKECSVPKIIDGVCHNCGSIVDDSNIVAEISFSEDSRGAAVVQGSYVGEEQGGTRNMGPSFKRAAASGQDRENTIREGESL